MENLFEINLLDKETLHWHNWNKIKIKLKIQNEKNSNDQTTQLFQTAKMLFQALESRCVLTNIIFFETITNKIHFNVFFFWVAFSQFIYSKEKITCKNVRSK